jgi:hypothetical protein
MHPDGNGLNLWLPEDKGNVTIWIVKAEWNSEVEDVLHQLS